YIQNPILSFDLGLNIALPVAIEHQIAHHQNTRLTEVRKLKLHQTVNTDWDKPPSLGVVTGSNKLKSRTEHGKTA
ncbi:MAG: hypothetical protein N0E37_00245, partial [Candidatus Thiodiazotropha taylori]|nr:hypothetical protein [Candidatus Thiodiazotropha taylori]MCW4242847.1 hypothetical protein [Candidatus Thiodiazotropha taylori]